MILQTLSKKTAQPLTREYLAAHLIINGKPADARTISRILNAKPQPTNLVAEPTSPKAFSLLR